MNDKKIIVLVGLPGCGKTYYGNKIKNDQIIFIDDIKTFKEIENNYNKYDNFIMSDSHLCLKKNRDKAYKILKNMFSKIEFIFWENDLEKAWNNVVKRNDGRKISKHFVKFLSNNYNIPDNIKAKRIITNTEKK